MCAMLKEGVTVLGSTLPLYWLVSEECHTIEYVCNTKRDFFQQNLEINHLLAGNDISGLMTN